MMLLPESEYSQHVLPEHCRTSDDHRISHACGQRPTWCPHATKHAEFKLDMKHMSRNGHLTRRLQGSRTRVPSRSLILGFKPMAEAS